MAKREAFNFSDATFNFKTGDETPWDRLGANVRGCASTTDAIKVAGLDWQAEPRGLWLYDDTKSEDDAATPIDMNDHRAIVRSTDGALLGVVGGRYTPIQNADAFKWFDPIVAAGEAKLHVAGELRGGRRVFALAKIGHNGDSQAEIVKGDTIGRFWLLANAHDSSMTLRVRRFTTRALCGNGLATTEAGISLRVRHTANALETLDAIREVMRADEAIFTRDVEAFRALSRVPVTASTLRAYVERVWPDSFKAKKETKAERDAREVREAAERRRFDVEAHRAAGKSLVDSLLGDDDAPAIVAPSGGDDFADQRAELVSDILDRVTDHFESGRGAKIEGVRGTMWGLYNAAAEYLQYEHGRGPAGVTDRRMDSMAFGQSASRNALALSTALEFAQYGKGGR